MGIIVFFSLMIFGEKGASLRKKMMEFLHMLPPWSGLIWLICSKRRYASNCILQPIFTTGLSQNIFVVLSYCQSPILKLSPLLLRFSFDSPAPPCKIFEVYYPVSRAGIVYLIFSCDFFYLEVTLILVLLGGVYVRVNFGWLLQTCPPIFDSKRKG